MKKRTNRTTHNMCGTRTYLSWKKIKRRCKETYHERKYYFDKGITVCAEWDKFEQFFEDMGICPDGYSIDRIDNSKGYNKDNCRWSDAKTQTLNREKFGRKNKTGFHGVSFRKRCSHNPYTAAIRLNYKVIELGSFGTAEEAARAYDKKAIELWGKYAQTNF